MRMGDGMVKSWAVRDPSERMRSRSPSLRSSWVNLASFFFGVFACCFPNSFIPSFWGGIYTRAGVYSLSVRP